MRYAPGVAVDEEVNLYPAESRGRTVILQNPSLSTSCIGMYHKDTAIDAAAAYFGTQNTAGAYARLAILPAGGTSISEALWITNELDFSSASLDDQRLWWDIIKVQGEVPVAEVGDTLWILFDDTLTPGAGSGSGTGTGSGTSGTPTLPVQLENVVLTVFERERLG